MYILNILTVRNFFLKLSQTIIIFVYVTCLPQVSYLLKKNCSIVFPPLYTRSKISDVSICNQSSYSHLLVKSVSLLSTVLPLHTLATHVTLYVTCRHKVGRVTGQREGVKRELLDVEEVRVVFTKPILIGERMKHLIRLRG